MNTATTRLSLTGIVFLAVFAILPAFASAATSGVSTRTTQLLPTGTQTCAPIAVTSVTPYVYDGALHSFDVVLSDASYVSIGGSVGQTVLPFRLMTRSITASGQLKVHTDVDSTMIGNGLPVSMTLLSAAGNKVCAATITFDVLQDASYPTTSITPTAGAASTGSSASENAGGEGSVAKPTPQKSSASSATSTVPGTVARGGMCSGNGALWIWAVLLLAFAALAAAAALVKSPFMQKNPAIPVAMILVPLIILVGFWYFAPLCRGASWVPIALLIIAIAGLLAAFREDTSGPLMLRPSTPKPVIPMPAAKPAPAAPLKPSVKADAAVWPSISSTPKPVPPEVNRQVPPAAPLNSHAQRIQEKLRELQREQQKK